MLNAHLVWPGNQCYSGAARISLNTTHLLAPLLLTHVLFSFCSVTFYTGRVKIKAQKKRRVHFLTKDLQWDLEYLEGGGSKLPQNVSKCMEWDLPGSHLPPPVAPGATNNFPGILLQNRRGGTKYTFSLRQFKHKTHTKLGHLGKTSNLKIIIGRQVLFTSLRSCSAL